MKCENCRKREGTRNINTCFGTWHFCSNECFIEKRRALGREGSIFDGKELTK